MGKMGGKIGIFEIYGKLVGKIIIFEKKVAKLKIMKNLMEKGGKTEKNEKKNLQNWKCRKK